MRSLLLIVLTLSLLGPSVVRAAEVDGMIAWPWKARAVVEVHGPAQAEAMVDLLNEALPEDGPTLVFVKTQVEPCPFLPPEKGPITICWLPVWDEAYGRAFYEVRDGYMVGGDVGIQREGVNDLSLYCHELMHALTGLGDRYGTQPDTSCLYGHATAPGSWDREFFAKLYPKPTADPTDPPKKKRHKKHRRH